MKTLAIVAAAAAAGVLALPSLASAADLSGAWKLTIAVADMTIHVSCDLKQSGAALTGTCNRTDPEAVEKPAAVTGTVDGATAKWSYSISFQDMPLKLDYTADAKSDAALTGKISVAGQDGTFTGTKG